MKATTKKFLEFNGRTISFLSVEGQYWIAIKPICEALNVDYKQQHKNILKHQIFSQLSCEHTMVGGDEKIRKMTSLPERYVYGWIFQIRSESVELAAYQKECCDILYNHFHGMITGRREVLKEKAEHLRNIHELKQSLEENEDYQSLVKEQAAILRLGKDLKSRDEHIVLDQLGLFAS